MIEGERRGSEQLSRHRMSLPGFFYFISTFKAPTAPPLAHPEFFSIVTAELKHMEREHLLAGMAMVLMPDKMHYPT